MIKIILSQLIFTFYTRYNIVYVTPRNKAVQIPFVKKNESDLPKLKLTYFNKLTKKNEDFFMYDYIGDFEKFGLEWYQKDLKLYYGIKTDKTDNKKIEKRLSLERLTRKKICIDESRVWNMKNTWQKKLPEITVD